MIYLQDEDGAITLEVFEKTVELLQAKSTFPLRAVYLLKNMNPTERLNAIEASLKPEDQISGLILGTHSGTALATTFLSGLGTLTPLGPTGFLRKLFSRFSNRWSPNLFIYLNSCSTLCGPEAAVRGRVGALARYLNQFGIQKLAVWGAKQATRSIGRGELLYSKVVPGSLGKSHKILLSTNSLLVGMLVSEFLFGHGFATSTSVLAIVPTSILSYLGSTRFSLSKSASGTAGRLAVSNGRELSVTDLDGNDSQLMKMSCEAFLKPEASSI